LVKIKIPSQIQGRETYSRGTTPLLSFHWALYRTLSKKI